MERSGNNNLRHASCGHHGNLHRIAADQLTDSLTPPFISKSERGLTRSLGTALRAVSPPQQCSLFWFSPTYVTQLT